MAESDAALARRIADTAGVLLMALQRSGLFEGAALGKVGDRVANAFIMEALAAQRPDDAVLSEEEVDNPARRGVRRVWIVDPLDGTREYGEARTDWAVHVGLAIDGIATVGAVALPGLGKSLCTEHPPALAPAHDGPLAYAGQPHPAGRGSRRRGQKAGRGAGADGLGRRQGHGGDPRRGRHLPAFGRPI